MSYNSAEHVSKNENDREEITLERTIGIFRWIYKVIKERNFKVPFIQKDSWELMYDKVWVNKETQQPVSEKLSAELFRARYESTEFWELLPRKYNTPLSDLKKLFGELRN